jgi:hypothetical protein
VPLSFPRARRTARPRLPASRRGPALIAVFAILLQAALFAWHHHPLPLSSRGGSAVWALTAATGHGAPGLEDDDCQICFALSHHNAAPVDFFAPPPPGDNSALSVAGQAFPARRAAYLLFRSRAPPRA